jgi:hypothetical protein
MTLPCNTLTVMLETPIITCHAVVLSRQQTLAHEVIWAQITLDWTVQRS